MGPGAESYLNRRSLRSCGDDSLEGTLGCAGRRSCLLLLPECTVLAILWARVSMQVEEIGRATTRGDVLGVAQGSRHADAWGRGRRCHDPMG